MSCQGAPITEFEKLELVSFVVGFLRDDKIIRGPTQGGDRILLLQCAILTLRDQRQYVAIEVCNRKVSLGRESFSQSSN